MTVDNKNYFAYDRIRMYNFEMEELEEKLEKEEKEEKEYLGWSLRLKKVI